MELVDFPNVSLRPLMILAVWTGEKIGRRIPMDKFFRWVYGLVFVAGTMLMLKTIGLF
jgi:uncharacterized membrane protein YfcA